MKNRKEIQFTVSAISAATRAVREMKFVARSPRDSKIETETDCEPNTNLLDRVELNSESRLLDKKKKKFSRGTFALSNAQRECGPSTILGERLGDVFTAGRGGGEEIAGKLCRL